VVGLSVNRQLQVCMNIHLTFIGQSPIGLNFPSPLQPLSYRRQLWQFAGFSIVVVVVSVGLLAIVRVATGDDADADDHLMTVWQRCTMEEMANIAVINLNFSVYRLFKISSHMKY